jgi:hypothetical protein
MRIPEGLCNAGPTFCRMMKAASKDQVGRNVQSYVNDIVVASKKKESYISDLSETFANMHETNLKLNLKNCIFRVTQGKVLGYLVSTKGIEASSDKIRAIIQIQPPHMRKSAEANRSHSTLNRFIVKLAERSLPFFSILWGSTKVDWGTEQLEAFDDMKCYLEHLPTLSRTEQGQLLILYVFTMHYVVSGALVVMKEIKHKDKTVK